MSTKAVSGFSYLKENLSNFILFFVFLIPSVCVKHKSTLLGSVLGSGNTIDKKYEDLAPLTLHSVTEIGPHTWTRM